MCILEHPKDLFFAFYAGNLRHHNRIAVQGASSEILAQESGCGDSLSTWKCVSTDHRLTARHIMLPRVELSKKPPEVLKSA